MLLVSETAALLDVDVDDTDCVAILWLEVRPDVPPKSLLEVEVDVEDPITGDRFEKLFGMEFAVATDPKPVPLVSMRPADISLDWKEFILFAEIGFTLRVAETPVSPKTPTLLKELLDMLEAAEVAESRLFPTSPCDDATAPVELVTGSVGVIG